MTIRWQPLEQMGSLRRQIDEVFNESNGASSERQATWWWPAVELIDTSDDFHLHAQLPGIDPASLDIQATREALMIKGERPYPQHDGQRTYLHSEFAYGPFKRLISFPAEINPDQIQAQFHNGLLVLTVPKADHARRRVVKVQVNDLTDNSDQRALNVASEQVAQQS